MTEQHSGESIERNGSYDIIYLDIEMKNMDGITVAKRCGNRIPIRFFCLYPVMTVIMSSCLRWNHYVSFENRLMEKFEEYFRIAYGKLMNLDERLHFEFNKRLYQIPYREIIYMESQRRVIRLVEKSGQDYRFYMKMKDLMQEISRAGNMFIRIHCSYVVNYYYIKSFSATEVVLLNGETLPVSTEYKNDAMKIYMDMVD